ncbi:MAG: peptidylprolyl isomerase [Vagococcus sp.]|uniref:peptidylprolyl isomerase n=1 Tax=Vagococcus sp. TaxID=1933889 RepID=UPI002FC8ADCA
MKNKSLKLAAVSLLGILTLAGCSGGKDVATMKGGKITEDDFYTELKKNPQTADALTNMIIGKVTENAYGKDVKQEDVDKEFKKMEEQQGGKKQFEDVLKQNNMDVKTYKESIKGQLAFQQMLKSNLKITDNDLKETWKTYHPAVDTQIALFDSKEDAEKALKQVNDGTDFTKVAKEQSKDEATKKDGGKLTFDSTMKTKPENVMVPEQVKEEAYKLEDGKTSGVITAQNMQTGADSFYIVKMVKNVKKGNDYKKYEKELKEITEQTKMQDPTFQQKIVGEELDKANIKITDEAFKDILTPYLPQKEEKKDNKKDDSKKSEKKETTESKK